MKICTQLIIVQWDLPTSRRFKKALAEGYEKTLWKKWSALGKGRCFERLVQKAGGLWRQALQAAKNCTQFSAVKGDLTNSPLIQQTDFAKSCAESWRKKRLGSIASLRQALKRNGKDISCPETLHPDHSSCHHWQFFYCFKLDTLLKMWLIMYNPSL